MPDYEKLKLGYEDLFWDTNRNNEVTNRKSSTGGTVAIKHINANHIPVLSSLVWDSAETVHDFLVLCKALNDSYDAFVANVGYWDKFLGFFADSATLVATHSSPSSDDVFAWVQSTKSFWHWNEDAGTPAWEDSYRDLVDDSNPTLSTDLDTDGNDVDFGDDSGIKGLQTINYTAFQEKTIASGSFTQEQVLQSVDTESDAATDDLDQVIPATNCNRLVLKLENSGRIVTIKHNTGSNKFSLPYDRDIVMQYGAIYEFTHDGTGWILHCTTLDTVTQALAEAGTSTDVYLWSPERVKQAIDALAGVKKIAWLKDVKAYNATGGTSANATTQVRDLNTVEGDTDIVSLSSNRFTPDANDYEFLFVVPAYDVLASYAYLYNYTQSTIVSLSNAIYVSGSETTFHTIMGTFTANGTDEYEVIHYTGRNITDGLGKAHNVSSDSSIYTQGYIKEK